MTLARLHLTIFQAERVRNLVGQGNTTAFQIYTTQGDCLGVSGTVITSAGALASNENRFEGENGSAAFLSRPRGWLRRTLATLGL